MQSVFNFLVEPKNGRSTSEKDIDGSKLLLNTEVQNHHYTSRLGIVKSIPMLTDTVLLPGDEVIVHHNVFRRFRDVKGKEKNSRSYYKENLFIVDPGQIFAYKHVGKWKPIPGYTFVKPLKEKRIFADNYERPLIGVVKYPDEGFEKDMLVGFLPGMEYEFNIEGERLYRVPSEKITIQYEYQGDEEEYNPSWSQSS